jgi:carbon storage regulator
LGLNWERQNGVEDSATTESGRVIFMLVLSRKEQQALVIDDHIKVVVLHTSNRGVRLGIEAPPEVSIHRGEVRERIEQEQRQQEIGIEVKHDAA